MGGDNGVSFQTLNVTNAKNYSSIDNLSWNIFTSQIYFVGLVLLGIFILCMCLFYSIATNSLGVLSNTFQCNANGHWANYTNLLQFAAAFCFSFNAVNQFLTILYIIIVRKETKRCLLQLYFSLLIISLICGVSHGLSYSRIGFTKYCFDSFGVYSDLPLWGEWLPVVPFLAYLATFTDQTTPSRPNDYYCIINTFLMIFCGFLSAISIDKNTSTFFYFACCIFFIFCLRNLWLCGWIEDSEISEKYDTYINFTNIPSNPTTHYELIKHINYMKLIEKRARTRILFVCFFIFPTVHLLGSLAILNHDQVLAGYIVGNIFTKLIFSGFIVNSHIQLQNEIAKVVTIHKTNYICTMIEVEMDEFRHIIANVAHDLKTPLSSLCSGIDLIQTSSAELKRNLSENFQNESTLVSPSTATDNEGSRDLRTIATIGDIIDTNIAKEDAIPMVLEEEKNVDNNNQSNSQKSYTTSDYELTFDHSYPSQESLNLQPDTDSMIQSNNAQETNTKSSLYDDKTVVSEKNEYNMIKSVSKITFDLQEKRDPLKILIVDDSMTILKMVSLLLKKDGHYVSNAENGLIAYELIQQKGLNYFDVILMDMQMPVLDGIETTIKIRELELKYGVNDHMHQVIIGCSANSDNETVEEALKVGVDSFIVKPFKLKRFYDTFDNIQMKKKSK
eukprot:gene12163-16289_t